MIIDDRLRIILTRLLTILASRAARRNETDEGGSMHVRRMAKDLCSRMKTFSTLLSTLLARVVSSSLPLFISSHSFLPPLSPHLSSSTFIWLVLSLFFFFLFLSLSLPLLAILPALQKELSAKFFFVFLSLLFSFPCHPFLFFVSYSFSLHSSLFTSFHSHNERH